MSESDKPEQPIKFKITRQETEKQPSVVSHVAITETAYQYFVKMFDRYQRGGFHDLMVLLGPNKQEGPVRLISDAALVLNPVPYAAFPDVFGAARAALREAQKDYANLGVIGVGTIVGNREDVKMVLGMGYSVYLAGGTKLYDERPHTIDRPDEWRIYSLENGIPLAIPPDHIYPIAHR